MRTRFFNPFAFAALIIQFSSLRARFVLAVVLLIYSISIYLVVYWGKSNLSTEDIPVSALIELIPSDEFVSQPMINMCFGRFELTQSLRFCKKSSQNCSTKYAQRIPATGMNTQSICIFVIIYCGNVSQSWYKKKIEVSFNLLHEVKKRRTYKRK